MTDSKQLQQMSQFSIIRELPGDKGSSNKPSSSVVTTTSDSTKLHNSSNQLQTFTINSNYEHSKKQQQQQQQRPTELKFRIEPIGIQPEDDDDLDSCPAKTRASWPLQINPWWKPADKFEKPPYSYATLIAHAILTSKDGRLTLSDIYKWISEEYPYYKRGQKGWQNSIRHNLSLNKKWFVKVDRRPTQAHPGKGGYWTLQVNMEKIFVDNLCQAGSHSRRHHDMGIYSNASNQYYRSSSSAAGQANANCSNMDRFKVDMTPNIFITRPEDFEAKKAGVKERKHSSSTTVMSTLRTRNTVQEKSKSLKEADASPNKTSSEDINAAISTPPTATPKTDPKSFIIRFDPSDMDKKRKGKSSTNPKRPPPKAGKRRKYVEPGSSTAEDDDSAVDVEDYAHTSKKRKPTTTKTEKSTDSAACVNLEQQAMDFLASAGNGNAPFSYSDLLLTAYDDIEALTKPSDVINAMPSSGNMDIAACSMRMPFETYNDFWMYEPDQLFLLQQQQQLQANTATSSPQQGLQTQDSTALLLTSRYPPVSSSASPMLYDTEAQNILQGLQSAYIPPTEEHSQCDQKLLEEKTTSLEQPTTVVNQHLSMKTIDLQSVSLDKTIHHPDAVSLEAFTDPSSEWFVPDFNSYNLEQYVDFGGVSNDTFEDTKYPEVQTDENTILNTYWPDINTDCFLKPQDSERATASLLLG